MFVRDCADERFGPESFYISSCSYFGLTEKIHVSGVDYYLGDKYYSNALDDKLIKYIKLINQYLIDDSDIYGDGIYEFIQSGKMIDLLHSSMFEGIPNDDVICNTCYCKFIEDKNQCDFCDRRMCDECQQNSSYHFVRCDTCDTKHCYFDGPYINHKCLKSGLRSGDCIDCGF